VDDESGWRIFYGTKFLIHLVKNVDRYFPQVDVDHDCHFDLPIKDRVGFDRRGAVV
jgi:hypothetical protein